jgi:hypothetical protein
VTVTAKAPDSLGSGIYSDSLLISICFDSGCTRSAVNSPYTVPVTYIVDASAGVDFSMTTVPLQVFWPFPPIQVLPPKSS